MQRVRKLAFLVFLATMVASCKGHFVETLATLVSFEGDIEMSMSTPVGGAGSSMTLEIKGDRVRTETGLLGSSFVSITDTRAKKSWTINNAARTYTEIDLSTVASATTATAKSTAKATNTGRHEKIAGYACDVWAIDDLPASHTELCMASGVSMIAFGMSGPFAMLAKGDDAWGQVMSKGFPMRVEMFDTHGTSMMKLEVTRVTKKSLPDSDFQIPAGYTKSPTMFPMPTTTSKPSL
jgi:hypothetical protein